MEEELTDEQKKEKKNIEQDLIAGQMIGMAIMTAVKMMFNRWKNEGWTEDKVRVFSITVSVEEMKEGKQLKHKTNNNKEAMYQ